MEFETEDTKKAEISLCIFPNLGEFVAIDARPGLAGRPRFEVLRVEDVFDEGFFSRLEAEFGKLLRRQEKPFLRLLSLPQEVEGLIRLHGFRAILRRLNVDVDEETDAAPSVAVLFLTGPFLTLEPEGLRHALKELFDGQLQGDGLESCIDTISKMADREREEGDGASPSELSRLIQGDSNHYATLWQSGE